MQYANLYHRLGLTEGDIILIILKHSPDLYYSFLGAMLAECIPSYLAYPTIKQIPEIYWKSQEKLFSRKSTKGLVAYNEYITEHHERIGALGIHVISPEDAQKSDSRELNPAISSSHTALLQHSSGTTGYKKGVALSHSAILSQVESYARKNKFQTGNKIVSWLPLYHDMGLIACFMLPVILGIPIISLDAFEWTGNPKLLFEVIDRLRCTHTWLPNFAFHHLSRTVPDNQAYDLSSMKAFINCSEPCKPETFELFLERFSSYGVSNETLQTCYAMAETVFAVTQTEPGKYPEVINADLDELTMNQLVLPSIDNEAAIRFLSVGTPIDGLSVKITDQDDHILPDGNVGEIAISGHCLFDGYYQLETETREKIRDDWYFSGDLGFIKEGELFITGRKKDIIIINGRNFYAHDIESAANSVHGIKPGRNVAVGIYNDQTGSEEVILIAETSITDKNELKKVNRGVKQQIISELNLMIKSVAFFPPGWLVKTSSGKISRKENTRKYIEHLGNNNPERLVYET